MNALGNDPNQSCALAIDGTPQAVRLRHGCPILHALGTSPNGFPLFPKTFASDFLQLFRIFGFNRRRGHQKLRHQNKTVFPGM